MRSALALAATAAATAVAAGVAWGGVPHGIDCTDGGRCEGTPNADFMQGGPLRDQIHALGGPDRVLGAGSVDTILGGRGGDVMEGGQKGDVMRGGPGDDAGSAAPRGPAPPPGSSPGFFGDEGNDRIYGGDGDDHLEGEEGRDVMVGGDGRDRLDAINDDTDGTRDVLDCGAGLDTFSARRIDEVDRSCEQRVPPGPEIRAAHRGN